MSRPFPRIDVEIVRHDGDLVNLPNMGPCAHPTAVIMASATVTQGFSSSIICPSWSTVYGRTLIRFWAAVRRH
jgi:hypothetical protein